MKYYYLSIPTEIDFKNKYIVFHVFDPEDGNSDPDVFISSKIPFPTERESEWKCGAYGADTCVVPKENVEVGKIFHVSVFCLNKCKFQITASLRSEILVEQGQVYRDYLHISESRLFAFNVPQEEDIQSISFSLSIDSQKMNMVHLYIVESRDPSVVPSSVNTMAVIPSWTGWITKVFKNQINYFCIGCTYKILVTSQVETSISLMCKTNKFFTYLRKSTANLYDVVAANERNCYQYKVWDANEDLDVYLSPFSGNPDIHVFAGKAPEKNTQPDFSSTGEKQEILSITGKERQEKGQATGNYYICIESQRVSSYHLNIQVRAPIYAKPFLLGCGITRTMKVEKGKMRIFEHVIDSSDKMNITFTLNSLSGNSDLYVKFCPENKGIRNVISCSLVSDKLIAPNIIKSTLQTAIDSINVFYDPTTCMEGYQCKYLIGVKGETKSSFSLTMDCGSESHNILTEGDPFYGTVNQGSESYFKFLIEDENTETVKIVLTSISGDADLTVSMIDPKKNEKNIVKFSSSDSYMPDIVRFTQTNDGPLNSLFTVTVKGHTTAIFSVTYTREISEHQAKAIRLTEGISQYGAINTTQNMLFMFSLDCEEQENVPLRVQLSPILGSFRMFIGVYFIPSKNNYTWNLSEVETGIYINPSEAKYRPKGEYYILIERLEEKDQTPHIFNIHYSSSKRSVNIIEGYPLIGNASYGVDNYYVFYIYESKPVTISVTPLSGDPDLFISLNMSNKMPSFKTSDKTSMDVGADTVTIQISEVQSLNPLCRFGYFGAMNCPIYITVSCANSQCEYTLQATQAGSSWQKLMEGIPQEASASGDTPALFESLISIKKSSSLEIFVTPRSGRVLVYGLLQSMYSPHIKPSSENFNFISSSRANSEVMTVIHSDSQAKCGNNCKLMIAVYCDASKFMPGEEVRCEFSITATQKIKRLIDGEVIIDEVEKGQFKYYSFSVPCNDCTVSFSLTPINEGDPDLYICKGRGALPTPENHDFKSIQYRGEFLEISQTHPFFSEKNRELKGVFMIGVHGAENCTYTLLATIKRSESVTLTPLSSGVPVRINTPSQHLTFFKFNSYKKEDITVKITPIYGQVKLRASVVGRREETKYRLPSTEDQSLWTSVKQNSLDSLLIPKTHKSFLELGTYLICVEAIDDSSYDIVVEYRSEMDETILKNGESVRGKLMDKQKRKFSFVTSSTSNIKILLFSLYGKVNGILSKGDQKMEIIQSQPTIIQTTHPIFSLGTFYITIEGQEDNSEFSLSVEQKSGYKHLNEGQPFRDYIEVNQYKYFLYYVPASIGEERKYLNLYATFDKSIKDGYIVIREIERNDKNMPDEFYHSSIIRYDSNLKKLGGNIPVHYKKLQAIGIGIMINSSDVSHLQLDMIGWTAGIVKMSPQQQYYNSFDNIGSMHTYELLTQPEAKVFVEVIPCFGEVEFFVTNSIKKISDRAYDISNSQMSNGRLYGLTAVASKNLFITVRAISQELSTNFKKSITYSLRSVVILQKQEKYMTDYSLEDNGGIEYILSSSLVLKWSNVRKPTNRQNTNIIFSVFMLEDGKGNMHTSCGIILSHAKEIASSISWNELEIKITKDMQDKKYIFNVLAYIPDYNQVLAYNPIKVELINTKGGFPFLLIGLILLAIMLGVGLYCYCRKYQQTKEKLEYEMTVSRASSNIGLRNYSRLVGQVQEELAD